MFHMFKVHNLDQLKLSTEGFPYVVCMKSVYAWVWLDLWVSEEVLTDILLSLNSQYRV